VKYEHRFAFECEGQRENGPKDLGTATQSKAKAPVRENEGPKNVDNPHNEDMIHRVRSRSAAE